jgi:hypothetical protein
MIDKNPRLVTEASSRVAIVIFWLDNFDSSVVSCA